MQEKSDRALWEIFPCSLKVTGMKKSLSLLPLNITRSLGTGDAWNVAAVLWPWEQWLSDTDDPVRLREQKHRSKLGPWGCQHVVKLTPERPTTGAVMNNYITSLLFKPIERQFSLTCSKSTPGNYKIVCSLWHNNSLWKRYINIVAKRLKFSIPNWRIQRHEYMKITLQKRKAEFKRVGTQS